MGEKIMSLAEREKALTYPSTQSFDPNTLEPTNAITRDRISALKVNAPELWEGGDSFIDIGSNKGYLCFMLRNSYKTLVGHEPFKPHLQFAEDVRKVHGFKNIRFADEPMRNIPFYLPGGSGRVANKFDAVFVGNCHHYFHQNAIRYGAEQMLFLKKLAGLAKKYVIIDGPFDLKDGPLSNMCVKGNWTESQKNNYSIDAHVKWMSPQFKLIRMTKNEGRVRDTAVFKRVSPDMEIVNIKDIEKKFPDKPVALDFNEARAAMSVVRRGNVRIKLDKNPLTKNMFLITNALSKHFAKTICLIEDGGVICGDVAEWINGKEATPDQTFRKMVDVNIDLSAIGLWDIQLTSRDYIQTGDEIKSVDVDMMGNINELKMKHVTEYMAVWNKKMCKNYPNFSEAVKYIATQVEKENCFYEVKKRRMK